MEAVRFVEEEAPGLPVSLGHRVHPTLREFRRTSADAIDASLKPLVRQNLGGLKDRLDQSGFPGVPTVITSSGGRAPIDEVIAKPVYLCMSGPSAISHAGSEIARAEGVEHGDVVTVDMGGPVSTSASRRPGRRLCIGKARLGANCSAFLASKS